MKICSICFLFLSFSVTVRSTMGYKDVCLKNRTETQVELEKSGKIVDQSEIVQYYVAGVIPSLDRYVFSQIRLEELAEKYNLYSVPDSEKKDVLKKLEEDKEVQEALKECRKFHVVPECTHDLYRSPDGFCNNLKNPIWGGANIANDRFLPAAYEGIRGLRKSVTGQDLPTPRDVTLNIKNDSHFSHKVSAFFSFYGQILVHDMTLAPGLSKNGTLVPCCPDQINSPNCVDVIMKDDDPFYSQFNATCIPVPRTAPYPQCTFEKRVQMNKKTAFVDVSLIYGSDLKEALQMRKNDTSGKLNSQSTSFGQVLPEAHDETTLFCPINETESCFLSGDERVNQHTMLTSLQTMLVRLHNIIQDTLISLNPHWDGNRVYNESRRLVVALQQYMVYKEYLPLLVGPENMKKYNLMVDIEKGSFYDEEMRPNILSEFSTAALRLHSMVPKEISKYHPKIRMDWSYSYLCPLHRGQIDSFVVGSCELPSEKNDLFIKEDIVGFLYCPPGASFGTDLSSVNIQRGRDHGLPVYVDVLDKCSDGKFKVKTYSDLRPLMTEDSINFLQNTYADVRDVDLWVGMISERPIDGGVTGFSAACISSIQFYRVKFGDSFFFTHTNGRYPFSKEQLKIIEKYSLAQWICDTTHFTEARKKPLQLPSPNNPLIKCGEFPVLDLSAWKEGTKDDSFLEDRSFLYRIYDFFLSLI